MKKLLAPALVFSLVVLGGCPNFKLPLHPPPTYAEDGTPSDLFFEGLAGRTDEMAPDGEIPTDPAEALRVAHEYIESRGIKIIPKAEGVETWEKFTTTFPRKIFVAKDWEQMSVDAQAEILWHEIVHVREYDKHTPLEMGTMYIVAEGRWALEVQAYRESFRVQRLFGAPEATIQERMAARAESLYTGYELGTMPHDYAVKKAIEIWMQDSV
jgi:hypothetical protein